MLVTDNLAQIIKLNISEPQFPSLKLEHISKEYDKEHIKHFWLKTLRKV